MRAAMCRTYGGPDVVRIEDVDVPMPGPTDAVVAVKAASVNFPDVLIVANRYQVSVPPPFIPGSEFAGVVTAVGADVTNVRSGDRVSGTVMVGAFAEQVTLPAAALAPMPDGFDFPAAAAFGVTYTTAYHALRSTAALGAGDWLVVLGAAGGVGMAAIDIARALGARVIAAASTEEKLALCRERGADATIAYRDEDLRDRIREITGEGADVVIDPVGGAWAGRALRGLRWGGRFVTVGYASGEIPAIPLNLVLLKGVMVLGFDIRTFARHAPADAARNLEELRALAASGALRPYVGATYRLDDVVDAMRHVGDGRALGKVVLSI